MSTLSPRRRGFTFVEFQVVIVVVAVLIALLLPAVQSAREAARKSQCQDHLHNFAIAMWDYESTYKLYPPGWVAQAKGHSNRSWGASILPFMEQRPLYDLLEVNRLTFPQELARPAILQAMQTSIEMYRCPTDPAPELNRVNVPTDADGEPREVALSSYVGINGPGGWSRGRELQGLFGQNSNVRVADVLDGTSNTVMIGERSFDLPTGTETISCGASIPFGVGGNGSGTLERFALAIGDGGLNSRADGSDGLARCGEGMSAYHPGGVMCALGDAKVTFLADETDPDALAAMMGRADGKAVRIP
jgi:hypothetical protein